MYIIVDLTRLKGFYWLITATLLAYLDVQWKCQLKYYVFLSNRTKTPFSQQYVSDDWKTHTLEEVHDFEVISTVITLNFGICVVDDGQEHVEQYEEDKHDVQNEVQWSKSWVSGLQLSKIEISEDDSHLSQSEIKQTVFDPKFVYRILVLQHIHENIKPYPVIQQQTCKNIYL